MNIFVYFVNPDPKCRTAVYRMRVSPRYAVRLYYALCSDLCIGHNDCHEMRGVYVGPLYWAFNPRVLSWLPRMHELPVLDYTSCCAPF